MKRSAGVPNDVPNGSQMLERSLDSLSVADMLELASLLESRVERGTASLSDFGGLAQLRRELERRQHDP